MKKKKNFKTISAIMFLLIATNFSYTQNSKPKPDLMNVKYGEHERNVLDVWFADKNKITPMAIFIHGGGFNKGSKDKIINSELKQLLEAGISVASISYRYKSIVPLPGAHHDSKLALQFIRSQSKSWGINKNKIGVWGSSAGAQISMWLAFSDDMANSKSTNLVERESTRVTCVATKGGQTTMESDFWLKHIAKYSPGTEVVFKRSYRRNYGVKTIDEANKIAKSISALALISKDDPPIFMRYGITPNSSIPSKANKIKGWIVHHVDFGIALKEKMDKLNLESNLKYPGAETKYKSLVSFFIDKLID
ncbi:alpha/beta hydrolase [uncultured Polaribacter sp.]|uniref:alpha/beta hydrolase n=1 Tax=uncultured Polaribacter sp. TaxID=174711 RepID=UPI00259BB56C|nr:alpha/beta hydrolase [uncultured Polaribacter sp.]